MLPGIATSKKQVFYILSLPRYNGENAGGCPHVYGDLAMTEYRKLPRGTEMIGTLGLGMGGIQSAPPEEIEAVVSQAIENGINFVPRASISAS